MSPARMSGSYWHYLDGRIRKQNTEASLYLSGLGEVLDECERARQSEATLLEAAKTWVEVEEHNYQGDEEELDTWQFKLLKDAVRKAEGES